MSLLSGFSNFHIVCIILDVRLCKPAEFQYAWHVAAVKTDIIPGQNSPLLSLSVSYTHLDVYKRQLYLFSNPVRHITLPQVLRQAGE